MRKRAEPVEVSFYTDPLCPWSWAMEATVASIRRREGVVARPVMAAWLPSLAAKSRDAAKAEWADAAAKTGARIDPTYWDRVAPRTSLIALAAVKAAELQGTAKGWAYLAALREAIFRRDADPTKFESLLALAAPAGLRPDLFGGDLGIARYSVEGVVGIADAPLPDSVGSFARRIVRRSWADLSEDLRDAAARRLAPPAFRLVHGGRESILRGFAPSADLENAIRSVQ